VCCYLRRDRASVVRLGGKTMTGKQRATLAATRRVKRQLVNKAKRQGICENFGAAEIGRLKESRRYIDLVYGTYDDRCLAAEIRNLEDWAMSYIGS